MSTDRFSDAVAAVVAARAEREAAEAAEAEAKAALLAMMQAENLARVVTDHGIASACKGRRTVSVTDPALKAEIKLLQERGVRTGRATERIGNPYVEIRKY